MDNATKTQLTGVLHHAAAQGAEKAKVLLSEDKELADRIVKRILEKVAEKQGTAVKEPAAPAAVSAEPAGE